MKKTIIASMNLENLGIKQQIVTLDTKELTIETKTYYNGKISRKETEYFDADNIINIIWNSNIKHYKENKYIIIII